MEVGTRIMCVSSGSWVDGKFGTVTKLDVQSSDGIDGHRVLIDDAKGYTVVPGAEMVRVSNLADLVRHRNELVDVCRRLTSVVESVGGFDYSISPDAEAASTAGVVACSDSSRLLR